MQRYEIFEKLSSQQAVLVETATDLPETKQRLKELQHLFPGEYFVFDTDTQCLIIPLD